MLFLRIIYYRSEIGDNYLPGLSNGVRKTLDISKLAIICDKYFIDDRKASAIKYKILVDNNIQYKSYFADSENIIISMISDSNIEIRRKGIQYIIDTRNNRNDIVRKF